MSTAPAARPEPAAAPKVVPAATEAEPSAPKIELAATKTEPTAPKVELAAIKAEPVAPKVELLAAKAEPVTLKIELAATKAEPVAPKVEPPTSGRPAETADQVLAKAKATIASRLDDPKSAEFGEMKRAIRINPLGKSVDIICGHVKGKNASGEGIGDWPFLYLVKDDEAYVVNGPPYFHSGDRVSQYLQLGGKAERNYSPMIVV